jgi:hypothetical protein
VNAFEPRCKNNSDCIVSSMGGTAPLKLFDVTSNAIILFSLLNDGGKVDVKAFRDSSKSSRSVRSPIDSGRLPDMFAEDMSNRLRRVRPPIDSGMVPPMKPPSCTAVNCRDFTSMPAQLTPDQSHTSPSGRPEEQDQPDTPREPILVELTIAHILLS